jgi:hypothetical protein
VLDQQRAMIDAGVETPVVFSVPHTGPALGLRALLSGISQIRGTGLEYFHVGTAGCFRGIRR